MRAGLVRQERAGRVARCTPDAAPVFAAAVWLNRYTRYWQAQFDALAGALGEAEVREAAAAPKASTRKPHEKTPREN